MDNEKIHVNILSLKGEKLQSFQIAPSETIYKLHLQIYELLGFDLHEEENNPELFWKKPRVPLVCLSQFLHSMPRDTLVKDYIVTMLGEKSSLTNTPLHIRLAIDTSVLLSLQARTISTQTTEQCPPNSIQNELIGHVRQLLPNFGSSCGGNRVRVLGERIPIGPRGRTLCRFGRVVVEGVTISSYEVQCCAPEHAPGVVAVELSADGIHWTADNVLYTYIDVTTPKCAITVPSPIASTLVNRNTLRLGSGYECATSTCQPSPLPIHFDPRVQ